MKQVKFEKAFGRAAKPAQVATARMPAASEEWLRLGVLIATGLVTGFVAAAIECL